VRERPATAVGGTPEDLSVSAFRQLLDAGSLITCPGFAELQLIKERFSKLLLGEDMSGSGKGVSTSVAISNAITNLYGQQHMLIKSLSPAPRVVRNRNRAR